ncbi:MAG: hypothetical protein KAS71_07180 [Bacteroidales bacterium]|nr:hypothetical protein [Bacteroidales bacterium]
MKENIRVYISLLLIYLILAVIGFIVIQISEIALSFKQISTLLTGALFISIIVITIFLKGLSMEKSKNVLATLLAIVLKFLLFIALIGIYALIFKELSLTFLVSFFIIYMTFTSYLLITFVRILKFKNELKPNVKGE